MYEKAGFAKITDNPFPEKDFQRKTYTMKMKINKN